MNTPMNTPMYSKMVTNQERFPWWLLLLEGIAAVIIGLCLVTSPVMSLIIVVQFLGFYWLFSGILGLVSIFLDRTLWGLKLCIGILGIFAGLVVIRDPLWSALLLPTFLVILLGIEGLLQGIIKIFQTFRGGGLGALVLGIVNIAFGLILLNSPLLAALALPLVVGVVAIIGGVITIISSFRFRSSTAGVGATTTQSIPQ